MVIESGKQNIQAPKPIQAGIGLTKKMALPSEEATETLPLPNASTEYDTFYKNFYKVVREQAESVVQNEEVRKVMVLIEEIFKAAKR